MEEFSILPLLVLLIFSLHFFLVNSIEYLILVVLSAIGFHAAEHLPSFLLVIWIIVDGQFPCH